MKLALIPPIPNLEMSVHDRAPNYHLVLSHMITDPLAGGIRYIEFYRARRHAGDYLILDNGAHELEGGQAMSTLIEVAHMLKAQEIVLPDVQQEWNESIMATLNALAYLNRDDGRAAYAAAGKPRLMVVPQGRTYDEWFHCFCTTMGYTMATLDALDAGRPVVGIAKKHASLVEGGIPRMLRAVRSEFPDFDIHMLGWPNRNDVIAGERTFNVRSIDTAKPFVWSRDMSHRDDEYFTTPVNEPRARTMIMQFQRVAEGRFA